MARKQDDKRFTWLLIALTLIMSIFIFAVRMSSAKAQDEYGQADFSRRDCFTRDKLVGCWNPLSAKPKGDALQGQGDFEGTWDTSHATCSACPEGWTCSCTGTGTIIEDSTKIFKNNSSAKVDIPTGCYAAISKTFTLTSNASYQISFHAHGDVDGNEDLKINVVGGIGYYNFSTDLWQAGYVEFLQANIGQEWRRYTFYLKNDSTIGDVSFSIIRSGSPQTFYIDDFQFRELESQGVTSDTGIILAPAVTADPFSPDASDFENGMSFDGVDDFLNIVGDTRFNPTEHEGDFTACTKVTPDVISGGNHDILSKYNYSTSQMGWELKQYDDDIVFVVSDDGTSASGHRTQLSKTSSLFSGSQSLICATYKYITDGASIMSIYVDGLAVLQSLTADGPVHNSTSDFRVGVQGNGSGSYDGTIGQVCYWNKDLSAIEANKYINPYFPGNNNGDGFWVDTCTQAASHATCSWDDCRDGTPNKCEAEGTGSMAFFGQYTELIVDNSGETNTGTDSAPDWTDWTESISGTGSITAYREDTYHKDLAFRFKATDTASYAGITQCLTVSPTTSYYGEAVAKKLSGDGTFLVLAREYASADCSGDLLVTNTLHSGDITSEWDQYGGVFVTSGTTGSILFYANNYNSKMDVLVDGLSLKAAKFHTPFVFNPTGTVSTTYSARNYRLHNPLSDYVESSQTYAYEDGWCVSMWVWVEWPDDDGIRHYFFYVPGTTGNNNRINFYKNESNVLSALSYDSTGIGAGNALATDATNWQSGTYKYLEFCSSNAGTVVARHYETGNSTWYDWPTIGGAGTGIMDDTATTFYVGGAGGTMLDGFIQHLVISPYSATWPNKKFNNGTPPNDPY